ncbi:hypothetical protein CMS34_22915 [Salmonella enterica]|nr:hypothetical protein [Salmonella enterica]
MVDIKKFVTALKPVYKAGDLTNPEKFNEFFTPYDEEVIDLNHTVATAAQQAVKVRLINKALFKQFSMELHTAILNFRNAVSYTEEFNPEDSLSAEFMDTADFMAIPDYPANRDVTKRMKREHMKNLTSFEQSCVVIVELTEESNPHFWELVEAEPENGIKRMKVDGHSRAYAWGQKQLKAPKRLFVKVYKSLTDEQINRVYDALTSPLTAETVGEHSYTLRKRTDFEPQTKFVRDNWKTAFLNNGLAFNEINFQKFREPLLQLDEWLVADSVPKGKKQVERKQPKRIDSAGVKTAIIKQIKDDGDISQFWLNLLTGEQEEREKILEVAEVMTKAEASGNGGKAVKDLADEVIELCRSWEAEQAEREEQQEEQEATEE